MQPHARHMLHDNVLGADGVGAVVAPVEDFRHRERGVQSH